MNGGVNATKTVESSSYARKIALALRRLATAFDAHNGTVTPGELSRVKWFFPYVSFARLLVMEGSGASCGECGIEPKIL